MNLRLILLIAMSLSSVALGQPSLDNITLQNGNMGVIIGRTTGLARVTLGTRWMASGGLRLTDGSSYTPADPTAPETILGQMTGSTLYRTSPMQAALTHTFGKVIAHYDYTLLSNMDLDVSVWVDNQSQGRVSTLCLSGLALSLPAGNWSNMNSWNGDYVVTYGGLGQIGHPSQQNPVGGFYVTDWSVGVGFNGTSPRPSAWLYGPSQNVTYVEQVNADPGDTKTTHFILRFIAGASGAASYAVLLDPYVTVYKASHPLPTYIGLNAPLISGVLCDSSSVNPTNPFGFTRTWQRLDLPAGPTLYAAQIAGAGTWAGSPGAGGVILWGLSGWSTRGSMYRPDTDILPTPINNNIPTLIAKLTPYGMKLGVQVRLGDTPVPDTLTGDRLLRLQSTQAYEDITRINNLRSKGIAWFYDDSDGQHPPDATRMWRIRQSVGPTVFICSEHTSDMMFCNAAAWVSLKGTAGKFTTSSASVDTLKLLRMLLPTGTIVARLDVADADMQAAFDECKKRGWTPMLADNEAKQFGPMLKAFAK